MSVVVGTAMLHQTLEGIARSQEKRNAASGNTLRPSGFAGYPICPIPCNEEKTR